MQNQYINSGIYSLPPQMISLKQKTEDWKRACIDNLENIGRNQYHNNLKLAENYEMIKGRFIFEHYFKDEGYADMVTQLTKEFDIPSYLRHYDIISQVINTLSGEWQKRPDNFRVKSYGERYDNDFLRAKMDMLLNYVQYNINNEINRKLIEKGIDPNKQDFTSEEEKQQYIQLVDQQKKVMTPEQIQVYMTTKWMQIAEIWGQHQLEYDKERFKLDEKEKREFEDMLTADRCFRHFYLQGETYNQETWNPINVFFHKSPEVEYIEEGDYAGRTFYLTISDVIDRYGWLMEEDDIIMLRGDIDFTKWGTKDGYGIVAGSVIPYEGFGQHKVFMDVMGTNPDTSLGIPTLGKEFFNQLNSNTYQASTNGLVQVTEAYWKSQKKIGKVVFIDEDGKLTKQLVDENFIVPPNFKELDSTFYDADQPDTIAWTWVNEVWKGVKINARNFQNITKDIYVDIKPLEFQFKGDLNPYNAKLPVCGQVFSVRNSNSMSLVDLMKPHQIGYNIAMNQLYQIMEREIGRFIIMDVNMFPNLKDWGGEKAWDKFMLVAKNLGIAPIDTSPANTNQAAGAQGGAFPRDINLDESARMASRIKIAEFFEGMALKQIGFNQYRLGSFSSESTAAGVEQGSKQSYAQTESYFTNFSNYIRRCHTMNLDIAQYVQSKKESITISYIKNDLTRAFTKAAGTDLLGVDMGVFVSNSQEQIRQLESLRQLALTNNQSGASIMDLADIITINSPQEIKLQMKKGYDIQQSRLDQQMQLEQQKLQQQKELSQAAEERQDIRDQRQLESKEKIAYIQTFSRQDNNLSDSNGDNTPDVLEYEKLNESKNINQTNSQLAKDKQLLDRDKFIAEKEYNIKDLELKERKIEADLKLKQESIQIAKILKGKDNKTKK